jgi:acyl carrier protein
MTAPLTDQTVERSIREFIARNLLYSADGFPYTDDASFLQEGVIDSLGVMELVAFLQSTYSLTVEPSEMIPENFDSVARLAAFIRRRLSAQPGRQCG